METGGSAKGEPFDIETSMNAFEKLQKFKMARAIMGDQWITENLHIENPALYQTKLEEKHRESMRILHKLATT